MKHRCELIKRCDATVVTFVLYRFLEVMAMLIRTRKSKFALGVKFLVLFTVVVLYVSLPQKKIGDEEAFEVKGELLQHTH